MIFSNCRQNLPPLTDGYKQNERRWICLKRERLKGLANPVERYFRAKVEMLKKPREET